MNYLSNPYLSNQIRQDLIAEEVDKEYLNEKTEQAARGIELFNQLPEHNKDTGGSWKYKDLSSYSAWKNHVKIS